MEEKGRWSGSTRTRDLCKTGGEGWQQHLPARRELQREGIQAQVTDTEGM